MKSLNESLYRTTREIIAAVILTELSEVSKKRIISALRDRRNTLATIRQHEEIESITNELFEELKKLRLQSV